MLCNLQVKCHDRQSYVIFQMEYTLYYGVKVYIYRITLSFQQLMLTYTTQQQF